jgi:hypothetical protein
LSKAALILSLGRSGDLGLPDQTMVTLGAVLPPEGIVLE